MVSRFAGSSVSVTGVAGVSRAPSAAVHGVCASGERGEASSPAVQLPAEERVVTELAY